MIQRIQSVTMFFAVLSAVFLFITSQDVIVLEHVPVMMISCTTLGLLGLLSIFSFKNRKRQILLNNISMVINALLIVLLGYWLLNLSGGIRFPEKGIEPVFPLLAIVFLLLSNLYIRRDERLVKSVDRLR